LNGYYQITKIIEQIPDSSAQHQLPGLFEEFGDYEKWITLAVCKNEDRDTLEKPN